MKKYFHGWIAAVLLSFSTIAQDAQFVPYRGGQADGHTAGNLSGFTAGYATMFSPFAGAAQGDGYAADCLISFNPRAGSLLFAPFGGGTADGYASDSLINFAMRDYITMFSPFGGGQGDGYANDSLIVFNPRGFITMFGPFAGGPSDGHHEGVICNFPKIEGDAVVFLLCPSDVVDLDSMINNYNFAARWNTPRPDSAGAGLYELRINNAGKCLDTATVEVKLDVVKWLGTVDNNWHNPSNWNTGKVPTEVSHVIIPGGTPHPCEIFAADAKAASVQAQPNGIIRTIGSRVLLINGTCAQLPSN
jgi:hypothetical protein